MTKSSHPVTRSIKEHLAATRPEAQVSHGHLLTLVAALQHHVKPDSPDSAEAVQAARRICMRVHERIARELRTYLPPPAGLALLLNLAAGVLHDLDQNTVPGTALRLAQHLLARPDAPERLPTRQVAELCGLLVRGGAEGAAPPAP